MSGIANVIPGANFSGSILGKVTVIKTNAELAAEIVSTYTTAIGDTTYATQLRNMVKALLDAEVWDGIDIYPMLGSTLAHKQVNLNPDAGFNKANLLFGSNATNVTGGVAFATADNAGDSITSAVFKPSSWADKSGLYFGADVERSTDGATANVKYLYASQGTSDARVGVYNTGSYYYAFVCGKTSVVSTNVKGNGSRCFVVSSMTNTSTDIYEDNVLANSSDHTSQTSTATFGLGNFLGATPDKTENTYAFNGICRFWVIGQMDAAKHATLNTIFKTFLDAVKPRT